VDSGFSGAQTQETLGAGNITTSRRGFVSSMDPNSSRPDPSGAPVPVHDSDVRIDLGTDGGTNMDRWMLQLARSTRADLRPTRSPDDDADVLQHSGVARDSVARLTARGHSASGFRGTVIVACHDTAAFLGRIDRPLVD